MTRPFQSPLSRPSDPETSFDAADRAANDGLVDTHEWRILRVLRNFPRGATTVEIAHAISAAFRRHMTDVQVARRMAELLARGQVFRRPDPAAPRDGRPHLLKRDGHALHFLTPGDMPLFEMRKE